MHAEQNSYSRDPEAASGCADGTTDGIQVFLFVLIRGVVVWEHRDAAGSRRLPLATGLLQHDMVLSQICETMLSIFLARYVVCLMICFRG